jgi:biopolymer transport protein ExbD
VRPLDFFMLAARFTVDRSIPLVTPAAPDSAAGEGYEGAPRIVTVSAAGLALNGQPVTLDGLGPALRPLMPAPDATVVVQGRADATVQQIVLVLDHLAAERLGTLVIAE